MADAVVQEEAEAVRQPIPPLDEEQTAERKQLWEQIYAEYPANKVKLASIEERKANGKEDDKSLTYGELDFTIINNLITMLKNQHTKFYAGSGFFLDLGSGCGKTCVAAALSHQFEKVIGVETMTCLDEAAQKANEKYKEVALGGDPPAEKPEIQFIKGDFVADLVATLEPLAPQIAVCVAMTACFGEEQLNALATLATKMSDDSIFVTYGQELPASVIGGDKKLPQERLRDNTKIALAKRGTDPASVEIDQNPPDEKPGGWRLIHTEDVKLPVGGAPVELTTKCFVFKKVAMPVDPNAVADAEPVAEA